jgi:hypothetical protein
VSPVKYNLGLYIPEDGILHIHRREYLKSYNYEYISWLGKYVRIFRRKSLIPGTYHFISALRIDYSVQLFLIPVRIQFEFTIPPSIFHTHNFLTSDLSKHLNIKCKFFNSGERGVKMSFSMRVDTVSF